MGCWLSVILGNRPWHLVVHIDKRKQPGRLQPWPAAGCMAAGNPAPSLCVTPAVYQKSSEKALEEFWSPFQVIIEFVCCMPCFLLYHTVIFLMSMTFYDKASYVFQQHFSTNIFSTCFNLPVIPSSGKDRAGQPGNGYSWVLTQV